MTISQGCVVASRGVGLQGRARYPFVHKLSNIATFWLIPHALQSRSGQIRAARRHALQKPLSPMIRREIYETTQTSVGRKEVDCRGNVIEIYPHPPGSKPLHKILAPISGSQLMPQGDRISLTIKLDL